MAAMRASVIGLGLLCACAKSTDTSDGAAGSTSLPGDSSGPGAGPESTETGPATGADDSTSATPGSTSLVADSTDDGMSTGAPMDGVFASGSFTIPAGARVEEFSFSSTLDFNPGVLDGRNLVVAVVDVSHPKRNQDELCPTSHPLDGCATVDYGAFGEAHDNRITLEGDDGPIVLHMYKDRSIQPETEPLLDTE